MKDFFVGEFISNVNFSIPTSYYLFNPEVVFKIYIKIIFHTHTHTYIRIAPTQLHHHPFLLIALFTWITYSKQHLIIQNNIAQF